MNKESSPCKAAFRPRLRFMPGLANCFGKESLKVRTYEGAIDRCRDEYISNASGVGVETLEDYPFEFDENASDDGVVYGWRASGEILFHTRKVELVNKCIWATQTEARQALFGYIEVYYNWHRMHSALGHRYPSKPSGA